MSQSGRFCEHNAYAGSFQRVIILIESDILRTEITPVRIHILDESTNGTIHGTLEGRFIHVVVLDPDRKSTRLNSSHEWISYAVFCLKKKKKINNYRRMPESRVQQ